MNKEDILQMTVKELEIILNESVSSINFESEDEVEVKEVMIDNVKKLFNNSIEISIPYYTNRQLCFHFCGLTISFKISVKKTGKIVKVSRLRNKDVSTVGNFKINDVTIGFYNPCFDELDLDNYVVKLSDYKISGGADISLKHRKEKFIDMLNKDILWVEIEKQDNSWKDIRKQVILNAAQPNLKNEYFKSDFNQEKWDFILLKIEENNKELINSEIEKIFKINF